MKSPILESQNLSLPEQWIREGVLRFEKCEFLDAEKFFLNAFEHAETHKDLQSKFEALSALFRLSAEMQDEGKIKKWNDELGLLMNKYPNSIPPNAYYCKAMAAYYAGNIKHLRSYILIYLKALRRHSFPSLEQKNIARAKGYCMLVKYLKDSGLNERARRLGDFILSKFDRTELKTVIGILALDEGIMLVGEGQLEPALHSIQKAHGYFMEEHNWYCHLYCMYWYSHIYRLQEKYTEAEFHLSLVERATASDPIGYLKSLVQKEREYLDPSSVDLVIDETKGVIISKARGELLVRKQFVLLDILKHLAKSGEQGLSKAQLIKQVWRENYIPQAHDNKLYYNINRLRKLIESSAAAPELILNWKEGYRLAPGKKIRFIQSHKGGKHVEPVH